MAKRNINSFNEFFADKSIENESLTFTDERSKSKSHEIRFQSNAINFENERNLMKIEENQS